MVANAQGREDNPGRQYLEVKKDLGWLKDTA